MFSAAQVLRAQTLRPQSSHCPLYQPTGTPRKWVEMQQVLICPEKLPGYIWKHSLFMPLLYLLLQGTTLNGP